MAAKGQSITVTYYAYNTNTNAYQTGDAANHTLKLLKDGTEASPTNGNAELDSTNFPGLYTLALTSAECTFNTVDVGGKSATANVILIGKTYAFDNVPVFALGTQGGLLTVGSGAGQLNVTSGFANANVQQWEGLPPSALQSGLVQAAIVSGAATSVLGSVASVTSGVNVTQWLAVTVASSVSGGFIQASVTSGAANVNVISWGGASVGSVSPDTIFVTSGTAQSGASATTITLASGTADLNTNNVFNGETIFIRSGGGAGQSQNISSYNAATKVATIVGTWAVQPGSGSVYSIASFGPVQASVGGTVNANVIQVGGQNITSASGFLQTNTTQINGISPTIEADGHLTVAVVSGLVNANVTQWNGTAIGSVPPDTIFSTSGTAQSGASATTITLASGTADLNTNNVFNGETIFIRSGGGAGQSQNISSYNATTKLLTIAGTWAVQPGSGSIYSIATFGPVQASVGGTVNANIIQVGGSNITSASGFLQTNTTQIQGIAPTIEADGRLTVAVVSGLVNANLTQWEGTAPNALQNGLVQAAIVSGAATSVLGSVASVTSGVNVTQWQAISVSSTVGGGFIQTAIVSGAATSVVGNVGGNVVGSVGSVTGNVGGNVVGSVASVLSGVNVTQWLAVTPASTVGGGFVQVAVVSGAVTAVTTTVNANVTQAGGTSVTANSGFLQVNVTQISGIGPQINAGGILQADVEQWRGSQPASLTGTFVQVDVEDWKTAAVNSLISGRVDVNVGQMQANSIQTTTYNASALTTTVFAANYLTSALVDSTQNNAAADALLDRSNAIETGLTPRQAWRLDAAAAGGVTSGALTTGFHILGAGVSTQRVSATTDQSGNRLSVTLTL